MTSPTAIAQPFSEPTAPSTTTSAALTSSWFFEESSMGPKIHVDPVAVARRGRGHHEVALAVAVQVAARDLVSEAVGAVAVVESIEVGGGDVGQRLGGPGEDELENHGSFLSRTGGPVRLLSSLPSRCGYAPTLLAALTDSKRGGHPPT
jgi:hypothetical protein